MILMTPWDALLHDVEPARGLVLLMMIEHGPVHSADGWVASMIQLTTGRQLSTEQSEEMHISNYFCESLTRSGDIYEVMWLRKWTVFVHCNALPRGWDWDVQIMLSNMGDMNTDI